MNEATRNALPPIAGDTKLLAIYGKWPSFHDAEVLSITLDRDIPSLRATIFVFATNREVDENGYYKRSDECEVTLRFHDVQELVLEGFNHQNVIAEISLRDGPRTHVTISALFGIHSTFTCSAVEVVDVRRLTAS